jgi:hypothetical protein
VKSEEGKGSSFYIELPTDPTAIDVQPAGSSAGSTLGTGR